jgi:hypothetical protein
MPRGGPRKVPSGLSKILRHLTQPPIPSLPSLKTIHITYAARNNHFGARYTPMSVKPHEISAPFRHFVKDDLPRIAFHNPRIHIEVKKIRGSSDQNHVSELVVTTGMSQAGSRTILTAIQRLVPAKPLILLDSGPLRSSTISFHMRAISLKRLLFL